MPRLIDGDPVGLCAEIDTLTLRLADALRIARDLSTVVDFLRRADRLDAAKEVFDVKVLMRVNGVSAAEIDWLQRQGYVPVL